MELSVRKRLLPHRCLLGMYGYITLEVGSVGMDHLSSPAVFPQYFHYIAPYADCRVVVDKGRSTTDIHPVNVDLPAGCRCCLQRNRLVAASIPMETPGEGDGLASQSSYTGPRRIIRPLLCLVARPGSVEMLQVHAFQGQARNSHARGPMIAVHSRRKYIVVHT